MFKFKVVIDGEARTMARDYMEIKKLPNFHRQFVFYDLVKTYVNSDDLRYDRDKSLIPISMFDSPFNNGYCLQKVNIITFKGDDLYHIKNNSIKALIFPYEGYASHWFKHSDWFLETSKIAKKKGNINEYYFNMGYLKKCGLDFSKDIVNYVYDDLIDL